MTGNDRFQKCSTDLSDSEIVVKENRVKFILHNETNASIAKVKVDGCIFTDTDKKERCDYIFEIDKPWNQIYFVELKGSDLDKACSQLLSTVLYFKEKYAKVTKVAFVVYIKNPIPKFGTKKQQCIKRFSSRGVELKFEKTPCIVTYPETQKS